MNTNFKNSVQMKTKIKFWILPLLLGSLLFFIIHSCTKDDTNLNNDSNFNPNISYDTMSDIENNTYKTVIIGTQTWMAENLKTTKYNDGTSIPEVTDNTTWSKLTTGAQCISENVDNAETIYGRLYNWYAVNTGTLCPAGWHVPTDEEWIILENYLITNGYNYDNKNTTDNMIGKALAAPSLWLEYNDVSYGKGTIGNNQSSNNSTGFTALPGGIRCYDGGFDGIGEFGCWWSSTEYIPASGTDLGLTDVAFYRTLGYTSSSLDGHDERMKCGVSVRCVKD